MSPDLNNYRGRRIAAYDAYENLLKVIDHLGVEDGFVLPIPDHEMPVAPSDAVRRELKNQLTAVFRLLLAHNDGDLSLVELRAW